MLEDNQNGKITLFDLSFSPILIQYRNQIKNELQTMSFLLTFWFSYLFLLYIKQLFIKS